MKKILFILFLFFAWQLEVYAQNPDIDLLKKLNVEDAMDQQGWITFTNSVYYVPAAYMGANLVYGLAANDTRAKNYGLEAFMSVGLSQGISQLVKVLVKRPRPSDRYPQYINTYSQTTNYSFPSGHSAAAFSTAMTMGYQGRQAYYTIPVFTWSTMIGYSRMRLGKHYPSDVLVGAVIGIGSGLLAHWARQQITR